MRPSFEATSSLGSSLIPQRPRAHNRSMASRLLSTVLIAMAFGCSSTASITLMPAASTDLTVPRQTEKRFATMMVLPPHGSERGQVSELAPIERVLLSSGVRVISSGVTGRVVLDQAGNRVETATNLSDLERALVLARNSNAEALLQVIEFGWTDGHRSFVRAGDQFHEVTPGTNVDPSSLVRVREAVFRFQARVINVENGEIVMSIDVSQGTSRVISPPRTMVITSSPIANSSTQVIDTDQPDRRREVVSQVMDTFLARLTARTAAAKP